MIQAIRTGGYRAFGFRIESDISLPELAQMVRDEVLRLAHQRDQFVDLPVAQRQRAQQPPAHLVPGRVQERRRLDHPVTIHQVHLMQNSR